MPIYTDPNFDETEKVIQVPKTFVLNRSGDSNLFSVNVTVGTPPQSSKMLLDINGPHSYVFSSQSMTYLTRPHKFY